MPRCVAVGCNNNGNHHFPKDLRLRRLWEKATKIKNFKASSNSRLCAAHFKDSDYQGISSTTGAPQVCRHLKKTAVPSIFSWNKAKASTNETARELRYSQRSSRRELVYPSTSKQADLLENTMRLLPEREVDDDAIEREIEVTTSMEYDTQEQPPCKNVITAATQTPATFRLFSSEDMLSDSKSVLYYTGLENISKFNLVFSTLIPMAHHLNYRNSQVLNVSIEDQFLLMLVKLRRNKEDFELAKMFGISTTEVGNIFITWVNFVYELWSNINIWPSRNLVDYYMPKQFKQNHPKTRVIIDATEIPITKPKNPTAQQATFSSYKHHNTVKFLVGATPSGLISFCSEGYAGSTSDRQITERCTCNILVMGQQQK